MGAPDDDVRIELDTDGASLEDAPTDAIFRQIHVVRRALALRVVQLGQLVEFPLQQQQTPTGICRRVRPSRKGAT